jgi:signal transduction histidine kinase/CheY-like chemotaxis protein
MRKLRPPLPVDWLTGDGEMGARVRAFDWSKSPLGPRETWSPALRATLGVMLANRFPLLLWWGPDYISIYNDAYVPILGNKHPNALGLPVRECWSEIWDILQPLIDTPYNGGPSTWIEDFELHIQRLGRPEETHFTVAYSPVPDDTTDHGIGGVLATVHEITQKVIGERRVAILRDLGVRAAQENAEETCRAAAQILAQHDKDVPFALLYLVDSDGQHARLAATAGVETDGVVSPLVVRLDQIEPGAGWPLATAFRSQETVRVTDLEARFKVIPPGPWPDPPHSALVVPIRSNKADELAGLLVAGVSAHLTLDTLYCDFYELMANQVATAIGKARAYEEERKRAEALAEIDRAKTAFFSNVSHEFRTPLTLMLGPLEDLKLEFGGAQSPLSSRQHRLLDLVHRNSIRLLKLTNALLDFARIEAGRVTAAYEKVDLGALTAELASNFRSATDKAGLRLGIEIRPLPADVYVDRDMWEKIVLNLLSNAFKFTFTGEIGAAVRPSPDGRHAEIIVQDTGTGIPAAELPHLFDRFRRVEGARGRSFEGSGIGLALVQELVKRHGGTINVTSDLGRGTSFTISLPFGTAHLPTDQIKTGSAQARTNLRAQAYLDEAIGWLEGNEMAADHVAASSPEDVCLNVAVDPSRKSRIVLADDNADMRDYVCRLLGGQYEVEAVADGELALEAVLRKRPDLILSDIMMPRLDGFGLLEALRKKTELRDIPMIFLSARAGEEAKVEGLRRGADDYLVKPFSARELLARVEANIELSRIRSERTRLLEEESRVLEILNKVGATVAAELNLERAVQFLTDAATELTGATFGSFFYNVIDEKGESYTLYTLSGAPREAFSKFPMPRNTAVFALTFSGEGVVRSDDILKDPRYGQNDPHYGMPKGHLSVRSYLAAPVVSRSGEVLGGLFFGHPEPGKFTEHSERLLAGIAAQAAITIDNARLFQAAEREVAERRRAEAALQTLNATLEQRVAEEVRERTRAEEQLRQVQKMEAIGQLTGGIAHDFNNMLAVVIGGLNILQRRLEKGDTDVQRFVDGAIDGAQRAAGLTQRLLAFSRQQPLAPEPINPNKMVSSMTDLLTRTLGEQIAIETVLGAGVWQVKADPGQLENAILNLCVNARDAMPDGGRLTIETSNAYVDDVFAKEYAIPPGQYALVAVADSGVGMSAEIVARAFDPFYTTKEIGKGTGLGLSQVYGFVRQSGGHVKIYSEVGIGTTVKVYLPRHYGEAQTAEGKITAVSAYRGSKCEIVLVVEDEERVRTISVEALRDLGYTAIGASSAREALQLFDGGLGVSLLFTDVIMPAMSGRELANGLRQRHPNLKVLYTTGYSRNAIVHNDVLEPGTSLLTKPFSVEELATKVRQMLDA